METLFGILSVLFTFIGIVMSAYLLIYAVARGWRNGKGEGGKITDLF